MDDYIERLNPGTSGTLYNYYEGMLYMKVCENNRKYVEIIHNTIDEFIRYIEEKNVKRKLLLNLHRIILDENLSRAIMSKRGFTYRYDNVITNA
jgi:S-adenosylmethionine:diacylglycerol 3-amino-3-carboxypropyl transferase